jgi:hypothetical protein
MPLGRRVSKDVMDRYTADQELSDTYQESLRKVTEAERALREAQAARESGDRLRVLSIELDRALTHAVAVAEAAERVAMGPRTYPPGPTGEKAGQAARKAEIERRKAKARPAVRPWTDEVDRLRTAREKHRLSFRAGRGVAA